MGRTSDARPKILAAAQSLFAQRGYSAIGVAEICQAAGVPKGSFYYFFASKDALARAVVDQEWDAQYATWSAILNSEDPPLDRLRRLFDATVSTLQAGRRTGGAVTGCLFGNLTLELSTQTEAEAIRARLQEIFATQVDMVRDVLAEANKRGDAQVGDPAQAARSIVAQLEGQIMFAKLHDDTEHLDTLWTNCLALLNAPSVAA